MNTDQAGKKAADHIQKRFNTKSLKVRTSTFSGSPNQILVKGELENNDGALDEFEVTISASSGDVLQSLRRSRAPHRALLEVLKKRFELELEAVIVSKDGTKAFVIAGGAQPAEEKRPVEKIERYEVEFHRPESAQADFLDPQGWKWIQTEIAYDKGGWKEKLGLWV